MPRGGIPKLPKRPCPPIVYGVVEWRGKGDYKLEDAVKVFKTPGGAERFATKAYRKRGANLVDRAFDAETGKQVFNVPPHCRRGRKR